MSTQLPIPGGDNNVWGDMLNSFLLVAHNNDGTLQTNALSAAGSELQSNKGKANGYAALDSTSKVPFDSLPTGTTSTTVATGIVQAKVDNATGHIVNVLDYGTIGTADDTAVWQAAVAALKAGDVLLLPSGYTSTVASNNILLPTDVVFRCYGTVQLVASDANTYGNIIAPASNATNTTVDMGGSGVIDGNIANNTGGAQTGIYSESQGTYQESNGSGTLVRGMTIINGTIQNMGGSGFYIDSGAGHVVNTVTLTNVGYNGLGFNVSNAQIASVSNLTCFGCTSHQSMYPTFAYLYGTSSGSVSYALDVRNLRIRDINIQCGTASSSALVQIGDGNYTDIDIRAISGNYSNCNILYLVPGTSRTRVFHANEEAISGTVEGLCISSGGSDIEVGSCTFNGLSDYTIGGSLSSGTEARVKIHDNTIIKNGVEPIILAGSGTWTDFQINNNIIINSGANWPNAPMIQVTNGSEGEIKGNIMDGNVFNTGGSHIKLNGTCTNVSILNNKMNCTSSVTTAGITIGSSASGTVVAGNDFSGSSLAGNWIADTGTGTVYYAQPTSPTETKTTNNIPYNAATISANIALPAAASTTIATTANLAVGYWQLQIQAEVAPGSGATQPLLLTLGSGGSAAYTVSGQAGTESTVTAQEQMVYLNPIVHVTTAGTIELVVTNEDSAAAGTCYAKNTSGTLLTTGYTAIKIA